MGRLESGVLQVGDIIVSKPGDGKGLVKCDNRQRYELILVLNVADSDDFSFCVAGDLTTIGIQGIDQNLLR